MSALRPGSMRGRREATHALLLLLLLLVTSLTRTVFCQAEDVDVDEEIESQDVEPSGHDTTGYGDSTTSGPPPTVSGATSIPELNPTSVEENSQDEHGSADETDPSSSPERANPEIELDPSSQPETEDLSPTIILIPVVLAVLIIGMIVGGILIYRRCTKKVNHADHTKEDLYLDGGSTEKVPMPMFEEDVPSVLELEMDELDQWMNKDG